MGKTYTMRQQLADARYDSIADFVEAMRATPNNPINTQLHQNWGFTEFNPSFYGADCATGNDVQKKMADGWDKGRDRLNDFRSKLTDIELPPTDRRRKPRRGDHGDVLDIHAVYAGRLDTAWTRAVRTSTFGPQRVEIVANMLCSGAAHADVLFWRGAAAVALADLLETAGYMVRLVVIFGGKTMPYNGNGEKVSCRVTVKDHGNPLDVTSTSAVIMPGFFRALGHAWIAGHCIREMSASGISVEQGIVDNGELLLSHKVHDHGTALAFVNDTIARINSGQSLAA
jgi:hypothetical protein